MQNETNDILNELENQLNIDNASFSENIIISEKEEKIKYRNFKRFFSVITFFTKYIITSSLIFWFLLITTNYNAYYKLIKNYIYEEELQIESKWIISSVEASNIKEKFKEKIQEEKKLIQSENTQKTSDYSTRKLINISNKNDINLNIEITPYENRVIIPKIWKNIPLIDIKNKKIEWENELNNIFMKELENWIIRYPGSSTPWANWTTFIFWHSSNFPWIKWDFNNVFALLDNVEYWDEVIIYYEQKKYKYKIKEKKVITPWDVSVLERNKNKSELTLMTCWPLWTTLNRLIVVWEIIEE